MRLLVTGGRDFADSRPAFAWLDQLHADRGIDLVIEGGARGADAIAYAWCGQRGVKCLHMPADWDRHGKAAGMLRNQSMLDERPDLVAAFPGGRGTADMVARARAAGVEVVEYPPASAPIHA